jgi:hypothetical protein
MPDALPSAHLPAGLGDRLVQTVVRLEELRLLLAGLEAMAPEFEGTRTELELRRCVREEEQLAEDLLHALVRRFPAPA